MPVNPPQFIEQIANSGPAPIVYIAAAASITKAVADTLGYVPPKVVTGYQHLKAGSKEMDDTLGILMDKQRGEMAIAPQMRRDFNRQYALLNHARIELEEATAGFGGSLMNWNRGRNFHSRAKELRKATQIISDTGMAQIIEAEARRQVEEQINDPGLGAANMNHPLVLQSTPEHIVIPQIPGDLLQRSALSGQESTMTSTQWAHHTAANNLSYPSTDHPSYPPPSKVVVNGQEVIPVFTYYGPLFYKHEALAGTGCRLQFV